MKPCNVISFKLNTAFEKLGRFVAIYPRWTIILSVLSSLLLGLGIIKSDMLTDFDFIFIPFNCRAYEERRIIEHLFPMNESYNFDIRYLTRRGRAGFVILTSKDDSTLLRKSVFTEIAALNEMVSTFEVKWKSITYTYTDICAKNNGVCYYNHVVSYLDQISQIEANETDIKYPLEIDLHKMSINFTGLEFGGVKIDGTKGITEAKAIRLMYFLDNSNKEWNKICQKWENEFKNRISEYKSNFIQTSVHVFSDFETLNWEIVLQAISYGYISVVVIFGFCILSSMTSDWVTSKPYLAVAGCLSAGLAIIASTGIIFAFGIAITSVNTALLFLILGIGVDDMFLLIAAWRATDQTDSVINRLGATYSRAAMSVTMTSLTNSIAFVVGTTVPIPAVRIFCGHGAVAVLFDLIYQLTFFGGCMALDGYREENKLHPLTFQPVILKQEAGHRSRLYQILFTTKSEINETKPPWLMIWCRDKLGYCLSKTQVTASILIVFMIYLAGASWGSTSLRSGIELHDLFFYDSQPYVFLLKTEQYFTEYAYPIQGAFNSTLDYSDRSVQKQILRSISRFHQSKYIQNIEFNWLKHFLFVSRYNTTYSTAYNLTDPTEFINCLRNEFFQHPLGRMYSNDVLFHEDDKHIVASRFILFNNAALEATEQKKLIMEMRSIADSLPFSVTVQSHWWTNSAIMFVIKELTIQSIGATVAAIFLVIALLSSHLTNALSVTFTILSIEFGVIGYMSLLGITINPISVIVLILSIGLSVDSSIHICYAYKESDGTYQERIQQTLFAAGVPILQGSCSTIFGVLGLLLIKHYIFRIFVELICLVITISFIHAIFFLPIFLALADIIVEFFDKKNGKEKTERYASSSPQLINMVSIIDTSHIK